MASTRKSASRDSPRGHAKTPRDRADAIQPWHRRTSTTHARQPPKVEVTLPVHIIPVPPSKEKAVRERTVNQQAQKKPAEELTTGWTTKNVYIGLVRLQREGMLTVDRISRLTELEPN